MKHKYIAIKEFSIGTNTKRYYENDEFPEDLVSKRLLDLKLIKKINVITEVPEPQEVNEQSVQELLIELPEDETKPLLVQIEPDWDWIDSLKSTRDNKKLLDEYADEQFGIKLNASKKIKDMIEDFKIALGENNGNIKK